MLKLFRLTEHLTIAFHVDGLSRLFASIVASLWPLTTLYAFDYMHHEGGEQRFFGFFLVAYGIVLGVAFAGSMVTMYLS
jgi:multicomponent Na+:H+ antiporter subunit D